jgi:hypothetical protein
MKNTLLVIALLLGLDLFSQTPSPQLKVVFYWETNSDLQKFEELANLLDPNKYIVEIAPALLYRDTALEYKISLTNKKRARISPFENENHKADETSFIKFYCVKSGMPLGTLWCQNCCPSSLDQWYGTCIELRDEISRRNENKEKARKF